ncbi:phage virion morphogenesis protein [Dichelobacter nodosus]|uniref:phage virion morphogenesis protein n=1 Tax=Dichelobacter nodosus TaxID=870 RepID=UPI0006825761|nr:phage virion morphogenesis protein [Dichelobacter nodosus]KNZ39961.1 hypothetical protein AKG33_01035 [Dichelobacter nodosus]
MLEHNLNNLDQWLNLMMRRLTNQERLKLNRKIGQELRKINTKRIQSQKNPDGINFSERKNTGTNRVKMFKKLRQTSRFKIRNRFNEVSIGWSSKDGYIARIHHYGLRQRLQYGLAQYPKRELIGLTDEDKAIVRDLLIDHFTSEDLL